MSDSLLCPKCGCQIEVSTVLASQIRENLRRESDAESRRRDAAANEREKKLQEREQALEGQQNDLEIEIARRLSEEKPQLLKHAEVKAKESLAVEFEDMQNELADTKRKLDDSHKAELQFRKDRRELEAKTQELELAVSRQLDSERETIRQTAKQEAVEENRLREAERDKIVTDLRHQIAELKRKSEQGIPQAQGEVMELHLEEILRRHFPTDTIEPVPVSYHGGDVLQRVHDSTGQECGIILWEAKRTKSWNDCWLPKLRDDQRAAKAHVAVLASTELPKGLTTFDCMDGVWVTSRGCLIGVAAALRAGLIEVARSKRTLDGKQTKVELLYNYFSGPEFCHRIQGIVEAFITMKDDVESEKRSMHRIWAKREKQLDRALVNTAGLYGDLGGLLGDNLPQIANLELAAITSGCDDKEANHAPWE
jgi:hypothetical protein